MCKPKSFLLVANFSQENFWGQFLDMKVSRGVEETRWLG
jgi:hypothetical protein